MDNVQTGTQFRAQPLHVYFVRTKLGWHFPSFPISDDPEQGTWRAWEGHEELTVSHSIGANQCFGAWLSWESTPLATKEPEPNRTACDGREHAHNSRRYIVKESNPSRHANISCSKTDRTIKRKHGGSAAVTNDGMTP